MKTLLALTISTLVAIAEEVPKRAPPPTVEQQLAAKDAQIKWLTDRLAIVEARAKAIADYYAATEALRQSDAAKPVEPAKK